ncbi:MAG TPA: ABC transporter substrate-binding protein [Acidimicrobiales bacterium]|jgi:osmoprotectant transport system substrate-binding protein|nr:ABC transporter substrate-binding protein [Acidimicrobiales bacterium]
MRAFRTWAVGAIVLVLAMVAGACGSGGGSNDTAPTTTTAKVKASITITSANFSENEMLAQMYGAVLAKAGYNVSYKLKLGAREVIEPALESGQVDFIPEYAGNYLSFLDKTAGSLSAQETVRRLQTLLTAKGITVLDPSEATDADAIAVTKDFAAKNSLKTISDLAKVPGTLTLGGPAECETRVTCKVGLEQVYGLKLKFKSLDADGPLTRAALDKGDVQLARVFTADADLKTKGYVVLEDDKHFQQAGNVTPVIRSEKLDTEARVLINKVSAALTTDALIDLNKSVQVDKEDPKAAAEKFLRSKGLL